jgi:hypothetical protein
LFALMLVLLGVLAALAPHFAAMRGNLEYFEDASPGWGIALVLLGVAVLVYARRVRTPMLPALAMLAVALLVKLAVIEGPGQRYDMTPIGQQIAAAQQRGQPIVHMGWHHGVYEFAGRMAQPLEAFDDLKQLDTWVQQHPDGLVVTFYRRYRFRAAPLFSQPFRGVEVSIWKAAEALKSGLDPSVEHSRDAGEDTSDD